MITFKDFLAEKAMNRGAFEKTATRQGAARIGFEFEMLIPQESKLFAGDNDANRKSVELGTLDTLDELDEYFFMTKRKRRIISDEYENWKEAYKNDWVKNNIDSNLVDQEGEAYARQVAEDEFDRNHENEVTFVEFVESEYRSMYKLIEANSLDPKYGWASDIGNDRASFYVEAGASDDDAIQKETFERIEVQLTNYLNQNVTTPWKGSKVHFEAGDWIVVRDGSISGVGVGVEVVSPPAPLKEALNNLKKMFDWMSNNSIETNSSTGLHINISLPNMANVDLVKLVLFMGDRYALKQFDRLSNMYTFPQSQRILNNISDGSSLPKEANQMIAIAKAALSNEKYSSVNISKLADGYLEFRIAGGEGYHKNFNKAYDATLRFVSALEVAADPTAERKLYLKKLSTIFGKAQDAEHNEDYDDKGLDDILRIGDQEGVADILISLLGEAKAGKLNTTSGRKRATDWVHDVFVKGLFEAFSELGIKKISDRQKAEFKLILKRLGVDLGELKTGPANPWKKDILARLGLGK